MVFSPVTNPIRRIIGWWKGLTGSLLCGAKYAAKQFVICLGLVLVTLWMSVLLYASFYHLYVPSASVIRPAHFKFSVCPGGLGICSFPLANVTLCAENRAQAFGRGQKYHAFLVLLVPDSASNRDIGMFMVISRLYDRHGTIVQESSRAASLRYQSDLLKKIQTMVLSPLYITGFAEQMQTLSIELFDEFWDDFYHPTVGVLLEIQSHHLTFYSALLEFHASYTGLRYYLFYYPISSAVCGVLFNCLWLGATFIVTWYKLSMELLDGPQVKSITNGEADDTRVKSIGFKPERQGKGTESVPAEERDEEKAAPRSYIQPFTMIVLARETETVGHSAESAAPQKIKEEAKEKTTSVKGQKY